MPGESESGYKMNHKGLMRGYSCPPKDEQFFSGVIFQTTDQNLYLILTGASESTFIERRETHQEPRYRQRIEETLKDYGIAAVLWDFGSIWKIDPDSPPLFRPEDKDIAELYFEMIRYSNN